MMGDGCVHELFRDLIQELTTAILQAAKAMASHAKVAILPDDNHMKPESKNLIALSNSNEGNRDLAISLFLGQYSTLGKDAESVAGCLLLREIAAIYPIEKPSLICDSYVPKIQFSLPYGDHWKVLILSVSDQIVACVARVQDVSQFRSHANEILRQCLTSLEFNPHRWGWPS